MPKVSPTPNFAMPTYPMQANPYPQTSYAPPAPSHYQEPYPLFVAPYTPAWSHYR